MLPLSLGLCCLMAVGFLLGFAFFWLKTNSMELPHFKVSKVSPFAHNLDHDPDHHAEHFTWARNKLVEGQV